MTQPDASKLPETIVAQIESLAKNDEAARQLCTLFQDALGAAQARADYAASIVNLQDELVCRFDKAGRLTFVNNAFCEYAGAPRTELLGKPITAAVDLGDIAAFDERRARLFANPLTFVNDVENITIAGYTHWQRWTHRSITDAKGTVVEVQSSAHDITASKLAQLITQRSMQQYRMLVQHLPDTTVMLFDADYRYLLAEGPLVQRIVESPQQIEGRTLRDVWPERIVQQVEGSYEAALKGESSFLLYSLADEHWELHFVPLPPTPQGEHQGMVVVRDVTQQRQNEAALRESESRLSQIARHIEEVFFLYDIQSDKLIYVSPGFEALWGLSVETLMTDYMTALETVHPADRDALWQFINSPQAFEVPTEHSFRLAHPTTGERHIRLRMTPVKDGGGPEPERLVAIVDDITGQKRAEQRAMELAIERERMRVLTNFIDNAAHEFRTPLSVISTHAYLMKMADARDSRNNSAEIINKHVDSITYLLNRLVTMSKLDGGFDVSFYNTNLRTIIYDALAALSRRAEAANVQMVHDLGDERFPVFADARLLGQAMRELLDNALHYTPPGGTIQVRLFEEKTHFRIMVTDTGKGMSAEVLAQIFQRFYREDKAHTTKGFGLGLPIARRIVELHGGTLTASSTPGQGTTCTLSLPRERSEKSQFQR